MTAKFFRSFISLSILTGLIFSLAACNTVEGLGRDMKSAGEAVTGAAQKNNAR